MVKLLRLIQESKFSDAMKKWLDIKRIPTKTGGLKYSYTIKSTAPKRIIDMQKFIPTTSTFDNEVTLYAHFKREYDRLTKSSDRKNQVWKDNITLARQMLEKIASQNGGKLGIQKSRKSEALYFLMDFGTDKPQFEIRMAKHLTYGQFHAGELPFKDYSTVKLTSSDVFSAWSKWKTANL